jgi:hypothetical protein
MWIWIGVSAAGFVSHHVMFKQYTSLPMLGGATVSILMLSLKLPFSLILPFFSYTV